jgi:hypothetical protein
MNLHSNFIHNGQKVETTELSMDWWIGKAWVPWTTTHKQKEGIIW